jgi:endoglucanase
MMKRLSAAFAAAAGCALLCACASPADHSTTPVVTSAGAMRPITSLDLSKEMSPGWNLGNSLEAAPDETSWGNAETSQALMNAVKAAGFKTVRIPVAWKAHADADDNIDPTWMARVRQVVDYAHNAGLYAIVNTHWDGGWAQPTYAHQAAANARLAKFWTQIATAFKDYDDHLLFAGTNEVMVDGDYNEPKPEYCAVQKGFNQVFVNTVRDTGGNNAVRHLVVQSFNTGINWAVGCNATLPSDTADHRLFMEVHYYDPFDFTINDKSAVWQWGSIATDAAATETWANEPYVDAQFQKMKTHFIDRGVPVLLGEYGAMRRTEHDSSGKYRDYWDQVITQSAVRHGLVPVYWDNGYTSNHEMGLFDRKTGTQVFPDLISTIVAAAK